MEELKPWQIATPIENHRCKAIEHCETVSISKRHIDGQDRWMWEQTQNNGHIAANEITFCPYCGIDLNRRAEPENTLEVVKKLWELYDKYEDVEHVVCGDAAKLLSAEPEKKIVFKDGICPKCGGPTHGVNNWPMKCANCGYEQLPTYLIEFTEDEISEFRHYLNVVKNRQSLGSDIRLSVFKLLHKFPDAINTRKPENGKNP